MIGSRNLKALFYATSESRFYKFPHFKKTIDKSPQKCGASRPLINKVIRSGAAGTDFLIGGDFIETF